VVDGAGTLAMNGVYAAGPLAVSNGVLGGTGTVNAAVSVAAPAVLQPGYAGRGALTVSTATFGANAEFTPLINGTASVLRVGTTNGFTVPAGGNVVRVNVLNTSLVVGTYTLIDYEGVIQGGADTNIVLYSYPPRAVMYLTNNVANTSIDLVIVSLAETIKWLGCHRRQLEHQHHVQLDHPGRGADDSIPAGGPASGDFVLFDDTAVANFAVTLATNVLPAGIRGQQRGHGLHDQRRVWHRRRGGDGQARGGETYPGHQQRLQRGAR
jgi:hypothetical protein